MGKALLLLLVGVPAMAPAASFSLGAVLRAGGPGNDEFQLGSSSAAPTQGGPFFPGWIDGVDHSFQLSFNANTNLVVLTANWLGIFTSGINWTVPGSAATTPRTWTIGAGGIQLTAQNDPTNPSSIRIQNLSLTNGLTVLTPPNLTASQNGTGTVTASNNAPITFTTPNGNGSWVLTGQVRFTGLLGAAGAINDDLRAAFDILATDVAVPEPASLLISALGFAALAVLYHFRSRRRARMVRPPPSISTAKQVAR